MKKNLFLIAAATLTLVCLAAPPGTLQRVTPTTSAFSRQALTNETSQGWRDKLEVNTNGVSFDLSYSTNLPFSGLSLSARQTITNVAGSGGGSNPNALTNGDTRAVTINNLNSAVLTGGSINAGTVSASSGFFGSGNGLTAIPGQGIVAGSISNTQMAANTIDTNKIDQTFYNWLVSLGSVGSGDLIGANSLADIAGTGGSLALARTNLGANNAANLTAGILLTNRLAPLLGSSITGNAGTATTATTATSATNIFGIGARHIRNRGDWHIWNNVQSNRPVRFLMLGDSVADAVETTRGIRRGFGAYMTNAGYGTFYTENPDGGTDTSLQFYVTGGNGTVFSGYSPGNYAPMTNGAVFTSAAALNANGIYANQASLYFHGGATLGSILVQTQLNGGSYGTLATINASTMAAAYRATNWTLPSGYYNLKFTSTGSNNWANVGLVNTAATTNSQIWAKFAAGGQELEAIITNVGFAVFLTNYAPDAIFIEAKDSVPGINNSAAWINANLTNYDVTWITPSPTLPDGGTVAGREAIIAAGQQPGAIFNVFDKYQYFTPTNYFFSALPWASGNLYADGAHLGGKGITYDSSEFADWYGVGPSRFALAGLNSTVDITGKANLAGGNTLTGIQGINTGSEYTNAYLGLRPGSEIDMWSPAGDLDTIRFRRSFASEIFSFNVSVQSDAKALYMTNVFGALGLDNDPVFSMRLGQNSGGWAYWNRYAPKTTNYTLVDMDGYVAFNGATLTATLPDAVALKKGKSFVLKNLNATALTVARTSSQTIDGTAANDSLTQNQSRTYTSDGANWVVSAENGFGSSGAVTIVGTQTVTGDKTFSGTTTLTGDTLVTRARRLQTDLAGGTVLNVGQDYFDTLNTNRTLTFNGTPSEGDIIGLKLNVASNATLTFPSSQPYAGNGVAVTTNRLWVGRHKLLWMRSGAEWLFVGPGILHNTTALVAPTITDDASLGYGPDSTWVNGTNSWTCLSSTVGAAVWAVTGGPTARSITVAMGAWITNGMNYLDRTPASAFTPTNSGDCLGFADAITNAAHLRAALPVDWNLGPVQFELKSFCTGTNSVTLTNSVWFVRAAAIGDGDRVDNPTWGTAVYVTNGISPNLNTSHRAMTGPITVGGSPTASKSILWEVGRAGAATGDTLTNATLVIGETTIHYFQTALTNLPAATP